MRKFFVFCLLAVGLKAAAQKTPFELSGKTETTTYTAAVSYYENIAKTYPEARLLNYGSTDFGKPLHLLVLSKDQVFDPALIRKNNKRVLLINNGIHPGEPEGIDASMMLARDMLKAGKLPKDVVICIIPLYNIDGSFNRTGTSRANQNGPVAYGFRGNSKNLDLNRDFIKTDSKNSAAFQLIFNTWQPEIFVDTHTSNGADYQYVMTLIPTQKDKLNPILSTYLTKTLVPDLYAGMEKEGYPMIPYVNSIGETPETGITGFIESPRYSTGYTTLHNTIGFMPETHMLKSYNLRVDATYKLLQHYIQVVERDAKLIGENKRKADEAVAAQEEFPLEWKLNKSDVNDITFKGFEAGQKASTVSGADRLYYDRTRPYTKTIKEWNKFEPAITVQKPVAYIIPKAWDKVIYLLKLNNVKLRELKSDQKIAVDSYYIGDFKTGTKPYEGHYLHSGVKLNVVKQDLQYYAGDYVVYVNQLVNRYIVETLEPQATDSYFNWNFFDSILDMKEHYSAYVFEDTATELLKNNPDLKSKLEAKKSSDPEFAKNGAAQLDFVYKNSDYYEKTHNRYPVARLVADVKLDLKITHMEYFNIAPVASLIFVFTIITSLYAFYDHSVYGKFMLHPYSVSKGQNVYTLITSGLVHADWMHLFFNMFTFYAFAFMLESLMGSWRFGLLYFLGLVLSDLPTVIKHKDHFNYNSLGASGAISAVLFSYILYNPMTKIYIMFIPIGIPAVIFGVLYLVYCAYASRNSRDHINHDAHFFGALTGLIFTILFVPGILQNFISMITGGR